MNCIFTIGQFSIWFSPFYHVSFDQLIHRIQPCSTHKNKEAKLFELIGRDYHGMMDTVLQYFHGATSTVYPGKFDKQPVLVMI